MLVGASDQSDAALQGSWQRLGSADGVILRQFLFIFIELCSLHPALRVESRLRVEPARRVTAIRYA